jgi:hypothetical protein
MVKDRAVRQALELLKRRSRGPPPWVGRSVQEVVRAAGTTLREIGVILRRFSAASLYH